MLEIFITVFRVGVTVAAFLGCACLAYSIGISLWKSQRTGGGTFCLWRFCLIYDRTAEEPFPGMGYELELDGSGPSDEYR